MSRTNKHEFNPTHHQVAFGRMSKMTYRDLKAACIIRGMDFHDVVEGDSGTLGSFYIKHFTDKTQRELLEEFDIWMDKQLKERGYKKSSPLRQFKQFTGEDDKGELQVRTRTLANAGNLKKKRQKRQRNQYGIFTGTKKEYTYQITTKLAEKVKGKYDHKSLISKFSSKVYEKVTKRFGAASEKSIRIWMKRALQGD